MHRTVPILIILSCVLGLAPSPLAAQWERSPSTTPAQFTQRVLLATAGLGVGSTAAAYGTWALKGGSEGCDLCWEVTAAAFIGGIVGGAAATTLAGGSMRNGLKGSLIGTAAGIALVGILDSVANPDETVAVLSFAVPYGLVTAYFSRR